MPRTALIVVDMLNSYEHADAEQLTRSVERMLPNLQALLTRAQDEDVLTIYVNDSLGSWNSDRHALLSKVVAGPHGRLVEPVAPHEDALFLVKARHSIFFQTPLEYLLGQEAVDRIVLAGQVTEQCILYSALDAYIRHLQVAIPRDAVAHIHEDLAEAALRMMELNMDAEVVDAAKVRL